ncbi:MAG: family permease [Nocardia sp.]|uniref:APC family permease n=1 Tax=Nocardia sp. TaxID=1821 RepID=UPI002629D8CF|nr:APC family permease [Nocardia sp.]MCU1644128.1 family permease [Nocardia sp.]
MTPISPPGASASAPPAGLHGSLGTGAIIFMVVAAAAPLTVIGGSAPIAMMIGDGAGFPAMFVVAAVVLLLFSVGLSAMSRHVPKAGAFFTYIGYGLGRPAGLGAAYLALLTYTTVQVAVYGFLGAALRRSVMDIHGPDIPWYVYALAVVAIVGTLGYRHIEFSSKVLGPLLIAEVGIVLLLGVVIVARGGAAGLSAQPFTPHLALSGSPGLGLMMALAGFIGFEATAIFRDEARDPARTIPRATYGAVISIGLFYTFGTWALVMAWGPDRILDEAAKDPGGLIVRTASEYLGSVGAVAVNVLLLTSLFACVLSFHNVIARYQHSMGTTNVLPAGLARVHARHASPHLSSLVQTATAATVVVVFALCRLDPELEVFTWFSGVASLGVAVLMALTCAAVIVYFARTRADTRIWHTRVAPALGLIGLVLTAWLIAVNFPTLIGGSTTLATVLLLITAAFPLAGIAQAYALRRANRNVYDGIVDAIAA